MDLTGVKSAFETFAGKFQAALSGRLRTLVDLRLLSVRRMTLKEFLAWPGRPTVLTVLSSPRARGRVYLEMDGGTAFALIERMLGSGLAFPVRPDRALTDIEHLLIDTLIKSIMPHLTIEARAGDPFLLEGLSGPGKMHVAEMILEMGSHRGSILIGAEWVAEPKGATPMLVRDEPEPPPGKWVEVTAILAEKRLRWDGPLEWRKGEILEFNKRFDEPAHLRFGGHVFSRGDVVKAGPRFAVVIREMET